MLEKRYLTYLKLFFTAFKKDKRLQRGAIVFLVILSFLILFLVMRYYKVQEDGLKDFFRVKREEFKRVQREKQEERLLDGVRVAQEEANLRPYAVMIENHPDARPQSGLNQAALVIEALAEGGIPRFLVFFNQGVEVKEIGPVRSARTYFLDWVSEFRPVYVHYGGETLTISQIPEYGIFSINGMYLSRRYFWRASYAQAPHNAYTSTEKLEQCWDEFGWSREVDFTPWRFKDEAKETDAQKLISVIEYNFSPSFLFSVKYEYNPEENNYLRFQAGKPHLDRVTGEQYRAKNVVIQWTRYGIRDKEGHLGVETIGGGKALIFQDGKVIEGLWRKNSREERTFFYNQEWQPIKFNRGSTWIAVLPEENKVEYR